MALVFGFIAGFPYMSYGLINVEKDFFPNQNILLGSKVYGD